MSLFSDFNRVQLTKLAYYRANLLKEKSHKGLFAELKQTKGLKWVVSL
jgi:hypothetical protein